MIGKLLKLHDIKHIISVDDCYSDPTEDEVKAVLFSEMNETFDNYEKSLNNMGFLSELNEIKEMIEFGEDKNSLIDNFLDRLTMQQLMELYKESKFVQNDNLSNEKERLIVFLNSLQEKGHIESFELVSSTKAALENNYVKEASEKERILWLIDQNFERVGESSNAGLELAKTIVGRKKGPINYVYILSSMKNDTGDTDDDIEKEFDRILQNNFDRKEASFIYYLFKQRVTPEKTDRVAKGLAQGFKRKACYELMDLYISCMKESIEDSSEKLFDIRQNTLNYLLDEMVKENGESYLEFMNRFVNIFQANSYEKALSNNFIEIIEKMQYYKKISNIVNMKAGDKKQATQSVKDFRRIELYNYYVNKQHFEISTGDIFRINGEYYLLVSQVCDTCLRNDGSRVLKEANLLQICDDDNEEYFVHKLSCFAEYATPIVKFRSQLVFPFEILDLCVLNDDGKAILSTEALSDIEKCQLDFYTDRFCNRIKLIIPQLYTMIKNSKTLEDFFSNTGKTSIEEANMAYKECKKIEPELLQFNEESGMIVYDVQRICRLNELASIDIVNKYGTNLSRIGSAFDFSMRTQRNG